ncbi:hypothetical protein I2494_09080 [Budviciaceae bacterium BWR-B9]|uniref:Uncharacterized protein n=1 Tax=Limnobaculum allomyrinae TaxID=2791986 RepID=A0ABS1IQD6_9GAMM|nr:MULTISPECIES: hypothetical protein [Limnobaculum]MBK5143869.1 hypothetical protein [Limnobaculum allomyrinae]MBV7691527.1 hypothetical protein [Limnobaculum sp. M2-1]
MATIHFRIDEEAQNNTNDNWLEQQINQAFSHYNEGNAEFINNAEMTQQMDTLKMLAVRGKL